MARRALRAATWVFVLGGALVADPAQAEDHDHPAVGAAAHGGDVVDPAAQDAHGHAAHGHHEAPGEINWAYGFWSEADGVEPSLLYRPKGMPAPLLALLLDTALMFSVIYLFGRRPLAEGLRARRAAILKGIEDAAAMKREAAARLATYQDRLDHIEDEVARVEREMREAGKIERERLLAEARKKREMLERDAHHLVAMEAKAAREQLRETAVRAAMAQAREVLARQVSSVDQRRLIDDYVESLGGGEVGGVS